MTLVGVITNKEAMNVANPPPEGCQYIAHTDFLRWVKGQQRDLAEAKRALDQGLIPLDLFEMGS